MRGAVLVAALAAGGCAHRVAVRSEPPGARVFLDNLDLGESPVDFAEERGRSAPYRLRLEKPGFEAKETLVLPMSGRGGGCLLWRPFRPSLPDELVFQLFPTAGP